MDRKPIGQGYCKEGEAEAEMAAEKSLSSLKDDYSEVISRETASCCKKMLAANPALSSIAEQIGDRYDIKGLLGKGRYSHVMQVQCRSTGEQYALKVAQKLQKLEGNDYKVEISVLGRCCHPSILSLHEVLYSWDTVYLLLELAAGGDLLDRINTQGPFSEIRGKAVLRMIASGVSYLHDKGITHRDLKLENLLFKCQSEDSQILITDFGLAHVAASPGSRRNMCETCGTAEYMSPEMLSGEEYCNKVDVWGLGVISYVVLSGKMPFVEGTEVSGGRGRVRLYHNIIKGSYSFSDQVNVRVLIDWLIGVAMDCKKNVTQ